MGGVGVSPDLGWCWVILKNVGAELKCEESGGGSLFVAVMVVVTG